MIEENKRLVAKTLELIGEVKWDEIYAAFDITRGSSALNFEFSNEGIKERVRFPNQTKYFQFYYNSMRTFYKSVLNDENKRFNKKLIIIRADGSFTEKYWWDEEKEKALEQSITSLFHYSLHDTLCQRFYDYELENGLLSTYIDDDGEEMYEDPSWFDGIFTFQIKGEQLLLSEIILSKDGKERTLDYPLPDYILTYFFTHSEHTHNKFKEYWQPWNRLVIHSINNRVPMEIDGKQIKYSLEEEVGTKRSIGIEKSIIDLTQLIAFITEITEYEKVELYIKFSENWSITRFYGEKDKKRDAFGINPALIKVYKDKLSKLYKQKLADESNRFNEVAIVFLDTKEIVKEAYIWDSARDIKEKQERAIRFHLEMHGQLNGIIYNYEFENGLLTFHYEYDHKVYDTSWFDGKFTFRVKGEQLLSEIILINDKKEERTLALPLPEPFIEKFLEHYKLTNTELKEFWPPWNQLELNSRLKFVPVEIDGKNVKYSLEK